jgi:hypothetical protein
MTFSASEVEKLGADVSAISSLFLSKAQTSSIDHVNKVVNMDESSLLDEQAAAAVVAAMGHAPLDNNSDEHGTEHESNHATSNHPTTTTAHADVHQIPVEETNRSYQQDALNLIHSSIIVIIVKKLTRTRTLL